MKILLLLIFIHFFAYSVANAQELAKPDVSSQGQAQAQPQTLTSSQTQMQSQSQQPGEATMPPARIDECKDLLPQIESDYKDLEAKYYSLNQSIPLSQENYLLSFNQMTEVLLQITQAREEETQRMSQSRDQLRSSLQRFNDQKTNEAARQLQESYMDLTMRIYSSLADSQKTLESLKAQLAQVEASRAQFSNSKLELESLDHQKLAIEAKMISLKIKCQPQKRY